MKQFLSIACVCILAVCTFVGCTLMTQNIDHGSPAGAEQITPADLAQILEARDKRLQAAINKSLQSLDGRIRRVETKTSPVPARNRDKKPGLKNPKSKEQKPKK